MPQSVWRWQSQICVYPVVPIGCDYHEMGFSTLEEEEFQMESVHFGLGQLVEMVPYMYHKWGFTSGECLYIMYSCCEAIWSATTCSFYIIMANFSFIWLFLAVINYNTLSDSQHEEWSSSRDTLCIIFLITFSFWNFDWFNWETYLFKHILDIYTIQRFEVNSIYNMTKKKGF